MTPFTHPTPRVRHSLYDEKMEDSERWLVQYVVHNRQAYKKCSTCTSCRLVSSFHYIINILCCLPTCTHLATSSSFSAEPWLPGRVSWLLVFLFGALSPRLPGNTTDAHTHKHTHTMRTSLYLYGSDVRSFFCFFLPFPLKKKRRGRSDPPPPFTTLDSVFETFMVRGVVRVSWTT